MCQQSGGWASVPFININAPRLKVALFTSTVVILLEFTQGAPRHCITPGLGPFVDRFAPNPRANSGSGSPFPGPPSSLTPPDDGHSHSPSVLAA